MKNQPDKSITRHSYRCITCSIVYKLKIKIKGNS